MLSKKKGFGITSLKENRNMTYNLNFRFETLYVFLLNLCITQKVKRVALI